MANQVINLDDLEEKYGKQLAEKIKWDKDYCLENNLVFKIEIIKETSWFTSIAFSTYAYTRIYEVTNDSKRVRSENMISALDCKKVLELMGQVNEEQKKQQADDSLL